MALKLLTNKLQNLVSRILFYFDFCFSILKFRLDWGVVGLLRLVLTESKCG